MVVKDVKYKYENIRFQEDFIICNFYRIYIVLKNNFLGLYRIEFRWILKVRIKKLEKNKKVINLPFTNFYILH